MGHTSHFWQDGEKIEIEEIADRVTMHAPSVSAAEEAASSARVRTAHARKIADGMIDMELPEDCDHDIAELVQLAVQLCALAIAGGFRPLERVWAAQTSACVPGHAPRALRLAVARRRARIFGRRPRALAGAWRPPPDRPPAVAKRILGFSRHGNCVNVVRSHAINCETSC